MNIKIIAIVSLGLNLVLAALLAGRGKHEAGTPGSSSGPINNIPACAVNAANAKPGKLDWTSVESEDYKKYIANLRAIGCPEETIRDIIAADVNKLFESRAQAARPAGGKKFEYWKSSSFYAGIMDEDKLARQKAMSREKQALLKELLGVDIPEKLDPMAGINPYETMLNFLSHDKQAAVMDIEQKYGARLMKSMKTMGQGDFSETKKTMAEKEAEVLAVLSPAEKLEYDLRLSQSAMVIRMRMGDLEPTEQEFRQLFAVQKKFDDDFGLPGMQSQDKAREQEAAQKELDRNYKSILGEDRYREYKYGMEWTQSGLKQIAEENNLPKTAALKLFDVRDTALADIRRVYEDTTLSQGQKRKALMDVRAAAENEVRAQVGAELAPEILNQPLFSQLQFR